jgi:predicted kinase
MYIVEFTLKHTAMPLTVQKKDKEAAEAAYKEAMDAIASGKSVILEATCDKVTDKKLALAVSELAAVQIYEKSGTTGSGGRAPGFFALAGEE